MNQRVLKFARLTAVACLALTGVYATAAQVTTQRHSGYQRLNFNFGQATTLKVETKGNVLVLHFDAPLKQSPATVANLLTGYATGASLSADGKDLTLTMNKPYRVRHFSSGPIIGMDIIGPKADSETPAPMAATNNDDDALLTTKPVNLGTLPEAKKPEAKKADAKKAETKKPAKPEPVKEAAKPAPDTAMLSTKKPEPAPKPTEPVKTEAPAAKPEDKLLTTKAEPKPAPAPEHPPAEKVVEAKPAPAPAPVPAQSVAEKKPTVDSAPFVVTARTKNGETTINFPYKTRTAAAVFERARDIWVVFSHVENINLPLLRSVLPKSIVKVTQYGSMNNTIVHFVTDGTAHATAEAVKDMYGWNIILGPNAAAPALDSSIAVDSTETTSRLVFGAFDVSEPLQFYDPAIGDLVIMVPSFEAGRGVANARSFPEIEVPATSQGITLLSARDDVRVGETRLGVTVETPNGLAVSKNLFVQSVKAGLSSGTASSIMFPYDHWYVPANKFHDELAARLNTLVTDAKENRAANLYSLVTLYLGQGLGSEALGYLQMIESENPDFYKNHKLALLTVGAEALNNHPNEAIKSMAAPELVGFTEADLWREYLSLYLPKPDAVAKAIAAASPTATPAAAPAPEPKDDTDTADGSPAPTNAVPPTAPLMHFLKYNKNYIRFYPPRIRQRLAVAAADAYIENGLEEKALATFDTLNKDDILGPVQRHAEYALALFNAKNKKPKEAKEMLTRLSAQTDDLEIRARARYTLIMSQMANNEITPEEAADALESLRLSWRGDALDRKILKTLTQIALNGKHYDDALRAMKRLSDEFPGDPEYLTVAGQMGELFEQLYLQGLADDMSPLKSLSLFYEFRDLTPIGDKGDIIIQKLADRLAAFDLLDRAAQLLENQIAYRLSGQPRAQVGARLALLYLLNHQPKEALRVLEISNFGESTVELKRQRLELSAQALNELGRHEDALNVLYNDNTAQGDLLKLDILWSAQDWPNMVNRAEDILSRRPDLTAKLTPTETEVLLKLALGYSFEGDYNQLRYLRDYYSTLLSDNAYKQIFDFITNDTAPLDKEDTTMLTQQISRTEGFLGTFKAKIAAGKLSEAIK